MEDRQSHKMRFVHLTARGTKAEEVHMQLNFGPHLIRGGHSLHERGKEVGLREFGRHHEAEPRITDNWAGGEVIKRILRTREIAHVAPTLWVPEGERLLAVSNVTEPAGRGKAVGESQELVLHDVRREHPMQKLAVGPKEMKRVSKEDAVCSWNQKATAEMGV